MNGDSPAVFVYKMTKIINSTELENALRRVGSEMKKNSDIQSELLRATLTFRQATENLANASAQLSHVVGKFALSAMADFQYLNELKPSIGISSNKDTETKQRNLNASLQQIVKFYTLVSQQKNLLAQSISADFEKPLQANLHSFKEMQSSWEKEYDKEIKKLQHEIKLKETEASKAGKGFVVKDMSKLSASLSELSIKISQLQKLKRDHIETAILTNSHHYSLVAHHLQQILKTEMETINVMYSKESFNKKPFLPINASIKPLTRNEIVTPEAPIRRGSLDQLENMKDERTVLEQMRAFPENKPPAVPEKPHRATRIIPPGMSESELQDFFKTNFAISSSDEGYVTKFASSKAPRDSLLLASLPSSSSLTRIRNKNSVYSLYSFYSSAIESDSLSQQESDVATECTSITETMETAQKNSDLVVVLYEFIGTEMDDLNVIEGDLLRVIAIEGEWLYGVLLTQSSSDSDEFCPVEIDGQPQVGWLPLNFTSFI